MPVSQASMEVEQPVLPLDGGLEEEEQEGENSDVPEMETSSGGCAVLAAVATLTSAAEMADAWTKLTSLRSTLRFGALGTRGDPWKNLSSHPIRRFGQAFLRSRLYSNMQATLSLSCVGIVAQRT